ncbi:MAG TPA: hypothetical protein VHP30_05880 [Ignavibacteriales bacterium]|nr:hypothetical protein [Ignavibacteriales bacterium]
MIIIVLILAVFVVYYMFFLKPNIEELTALNNANDGKRISVSTNEQIQQNIGLIEDKIAEDKQLIAKFGDTVLSQFDQPDALVYLYNVISKYGQKITFNFQEATDTGNIKVNVVTVTLNAKYDGLKSIVKSLNEGDYYVKVTGINATSDIPIDEPAVQTVEGASEAVQPISAPTAPPVQDDILNVTMTLEFYNFGGEIPPDKEYPFSGGASYGGDIFF